MFRRRPNDFDTALPDALRAVRDGLRGRLSLEHAIRHAAEQVGSPLSPLVAKMAAGRPLADVLDDAARATPEADLSFALVLLSVQARAGGDPAPAVAALEARARRRLAAAREVRSLTTQARLSARAMMLLTPAFLLLLVALDPRGMWQALARPATRSALAAGAGLQVLGAMWITRIMSGPLRASPGPDAPSRLLRIPVARAAVAMVVRGRERRRTDALPDEIAHAAEVTALALSSGVSPTRALELVAPCVPGTFGRSVREAATAVRAGAGLADALRHAAVDGCPQARRFVDSFADGHALGVPVAETLRGLAQEIREARAAAINERVRAASLKVLLPLGLLILPSFVLSCLVPLFVNGLRGISL